MRPGSHARRKRVRPFALITLSLLLLLAFHLQFILHHLLAISPSSNQPQSTTTAASHTVSWRIVTFSRHCEVIVWPKSDIPAHPVSVFPSSDNLTYRELVDNAATLSIAKAPRPPSTPPRRKPFCPPQRIRIHALCYGGDAARPG